MKNRLYTKSYFVKRLRESGFKVQVVFDKYNPSGHRYWTIVVDPGRKDVMITCFKKNSDDYSFTVQTEHISNYSLITQSMDVIRNFISNIVNSPEL